MLLQRRYKHFFLRTALTFLSNSTVNAKQKISYSTKQYEISTEICVLFNSQQLIDKILNLTTWPRRGGQYKN